MAVSGWPMSLLRGSFTGWVERQRWRESVRKYTVVTFKPFLLVLISKEGKSLEKKETKMALELTLVAHHQDQVPLLTSMAKSFQGNVANTW